MKCIPRPYRGPADGHGRVLTPTSGAGVSDVYVNRWRSGRVETDAHPDPSIGGNVRRPCILEDGGPSHNNERDEYDEEDEGCCDEGVAEHEGKKTFWGGGTAGYYAPVFVVPQQRIHGPAVGLGDSGAGSEIAWIPRIDGRGSGWHGCVVSVVV